MNALGNTEATNIPVISAQAEIHGTATMAGNRIGGCIRTSGAEVWVQKVSNSRLLNFQSADPKGFKWPRLKVTTSGHESH